MININSKIFLTGHKGMLGSSILRLLKKKGYKKIITVDKKKLDLRNHDLVKKFFKIKKPDAVIIAAAKVGGIKANMDYPADFITENLQIHTSSSCGRICQPYALRCAGIRGNLTHEAYAEYTQPGEKPNQ